MGYPQEIEISLEITNGQKITYHDSGPDFKNVELTLQPITDGQALKCFVSHVSDYLANGPKVTEINFQGPTAPSGINFSINFSKNWSFQDKQRLFE